ncbi:MAG: hypothetical protein D6708_12915 [Candidatus Dadabacteria bacterium]|nr:MAG: hypothetical protein D6708_12915 [Candidatus Dadabacteria bacterium]
MSVGTLELLGQTVNPGDAESLSLLSSGGTLYVAVEDNPTAGGGPVESRVYRWTGSAWDAVGGALNDPAEFDALQPWLFEYDGDLYCALEQVVEGTGSRSEVLVRKWNKTAGAWETLGRFRNDETEGDANYPVVAAQGDGFWVAWEEKQGDGGALRVYARRFDGKSWGSVARVDEAGAETSATRPKIAVWNGRVVVCWFEETRDTDGRLTASEARASAWDGASWAPLGAQPVSPAGTRAAFPWVAATADGTLWLADQEERADGTWRIAVRRWSGSEWAEMTGDGLWGDVESEPGGDAREPTLAVIGETLVMAWHELHAPPAPSEAHLRVGNAGGELSDPALTVPLPAGTAASVAVVAAHGGMPAVGVIDGDHKVWVAVGTAP